MNTAPVTGPFAGGKPPGGSPLASADNLSWRDRFAALGNLPAFFKLVWETSPALFVGNAFLRLIQAAIPALSLYIGKLIIDQVVNLTKVGGGGDTTFLWELVAAEFGLAIISTAIGRAVSLMDGLLGDKFANATS
ncbi:MAG TPA: ABC transporter ATP-binding protein, partial [Fibrella sp.]